MIVLPPLKIKYFVNLDNVADIITAPAIQPISNPNIDENLSSTVTYTETEMIITISENLSADESAVVYIDGKYIILKPNTITATIPLSSDDSTLGSINVNATVTATYIQKTDDKFYKYGSVEQPAGTEGLDPVNPTGSTQDLINLAPGGIGTGKDWETSDIIYDGAKAPFVDKFTDLLWLDGVNNPFSFNMKAGSDKNLYLFASSKDTYNFTFDLLFVKEVDGNKYSFTANGNGAERRVKYVGEGHADDWPGQVVIGSIYYDVDPEFTDADANAEKSLGSRDVKIYMIVKTFGGAGEATLAGRNVIRIK